VRGGWGEGASVDGVEVRDWRDAVWDLRCEEFVHIGRVVGEGVGGEGDDVDSWLVGCDAEDGARWCGGAGGVEAHAVLDMVVEVGGGAGEGAADETGGLDGVEGWGE
jgi:hypothetical protein